jgi:hypothetical protein
MVSSSNFAAGKTAGLGRAAMFMNFIEMMDEWIDMMKKNRGDVQMGMLAVPMVDDMLKTASTYNMAQGKGVQAQSAVSQIGTMLVAMA